MACGICNISLRPPILPPRRTPAREELHAGSSDLAGKSGQTASRRAMRLFSINCLVSLKTTIIWGSHPNLSMPGRKHCSSVMNCDTEKYSTHTTISGYWVGPDTEDGWGYIEAAVNRSFD